MTGAPRSKEFDDVYFSAENGLEETKHVFLRGNGLPGAWAGKRRFAIGETGFGTGLNFLGAWNLFQQTVEPGQHMDYVSIEKFPLSAEEIRNALAPWQAELGAEMEILLAQYPPPVPGFHRIFLGSYVTLTLVFDDVNRVLPEIEGVFDAWFLDGFKPASNPEMWTDTVFQNVARLSRPGTRFATFTAAGFVKRGLQSAGFDVKKIPGFGTKRDMLTGVYR